MVIGFNNFGCSRKLDRTYKSLIDDLGHVYSNHDGFKRLKMDLGIVTS